MSFNQFTNLDFNDLRTQIKDYLRVNQNFTDFDFEGSNFSVLIDLTTPPALIIFLKISSFISSDLNNSVKSSIS